MRASCMEWGHSTLLGILLPPWKKFTDFFQSFDALAIGLCTLINVNGGRVEAIFFPEGTDVPIKICG